MGSCPFANFTVLRHSPAGTVSHGSSPRRNLGCPARLVGDVFPVKFVGVQLSPSFGFADAATADIGYIIAPNSASKTMSNLLIYYLLSKKVNFASHIALT